MDSYQPTWGKNQVKTEYFIMSQGQMNVKALIFNVSVFRRD